MKKALILIDIQNDFVPGGALAVTDGDKVVPVANALMDKYDLVIASQDWHPAGHKSFASQHECNKIGDIIELDGLQQILWPDHCVQETSGAEFAAGLDVDKIDKIIYKGTDVNIDSYSCFFDNARRKSTGLDNYLKAQDVDEVCIVGLATDYCVKFSALDAVSLGYQTTVVLDGCRGVELNAGDCEKAVKEMEEAGVVIS